MWSDNWIWKEKMIPGKMLWNLKVSIPEPASWVLIEHWSFFHFQERIEYLYYQRVNIVLAYIEGFSKKFWERTHLLVGAERIISILDPDGNLRQRSLLPPPRDSVCRKHRKYIYCKWQKQMHLYCTLKSASLYCFAAPPFQLLFNSHCSPWKSFGHNNNKRRI